MLQTFRCVYKSSNLEKTILTEISQCTAVWSLQMGQMGLKMTLSTLTMSGDHQASSGAQIAFTILSAASIGDTVTQCTGHERGVANAVTVGQNNFF